MVATRDAHDLFPFRNLRSNPPPPRAENFSPKGGIFKKFHGFLRFLHVSRDPFLRKILDPIFFKRSLFIAFLLNNFFKISQKFSKAAAWAPRNLFSGTSRQKSVQSPSPCPSAAEKAHLKPTPGREDAKGKGHANSLGHPWC